MSVPAKYVRAGTRLIADGGFSCLLHGEGVEVFADGGDRLYVPCARGRHFLDGQLNERNEYVGFALVVERK